MPRTLTRRLALLLMLLSACSSQQAMRGAAVELKLLPPGEGPQPALLKQKLSLSDGQREQQFIAVARFDRQRLRLVVLLPGGQRLLTLDYDGEQLNEESFTGFDLPGRDILAIMQFADWPPASLARHYPASEGWRLQISAAERRLLTDSARVLTIAYGPGELRVDNHQEAYRVIVQTLEKTEL